jgi:glycine/D-amino acid oxidase-like deaminating enzyme
VIVLEQAGLGSGASGVNAGTLSLQIKRVKLMPYALKGLALWQAAGARVGYHKTGGFTLAFNGREAQLLHERMALKRAAGAPIEIVSPNWVAMREPGLSRRIVAASWCPEDGYADSTLTGVYYRGLLADAGIAVRENAAVTAIGRTAAGFELMAAGERIAARRLLLACGGWMRTAAAMLGLDLPVRARVNTVSVTERGPVLMHSVIGHATGLLTMKQKDNGQMLIGGGWQGRGTPGDGGSEVVADTLLPNLRLAQFVLPELGRFRLLRAWAGFEANVPDFYPLAGAAPGVPGAYLLGCVRGGYTIGPYIGRLMGDLILDRAPELPLFVPGRFQSGASA